MDVMVVVVGRCRKRGGEKEEVEERERDGGRHHEGSRRVAAERKSMKEPHRSELPLKSESIQIPKNNI